MSKADQEQPSGWRGWFRLNGAPPAWNLVRYMVCGLFAGIGLSPPYPVIGGGLTTMGSVLLAGAPTGAVGNWAERRLLDTAVGCAVALVATYLFWPRDRETETPVPAPT